MGKSAGQLSDVVFIASPCAVDATEGAQQDVCRGWTCTVQSYCPVLDASWRAGRYSDRVAGCGPFAVCADMLVTVSTC
jgi:hypothetical protein